MNRVSVYVSSTVGLLEIRMGMGLQSMRGGWDIILEILLSEVAISNPGTISHSSYG